MGYEEDDDEEKICECDHRRWWGNRLRRLENLGQLTAIPRRRSYRQNLPCECRHGRNMTWIERSIWPSHQFQSYHSWILQGTILDWSPCMCDQHKNQNYCSGIQDLPGPTSRGNQIELRFWALTKSHQWMRMLIPRCWRWCSWWWDQRRGEWWGRPRRWRRWLRSGRRYLVRNSGEQDRTKEDRH